VRQSEARGLRPESHLRENLPRAALLPPAALQAALPESGAQRLPPGRVRVRRQLLPDGEEAAPAVQAGLQDEPRRGGSTRGARGPAGRDRAGGPPGDGPTHGLRLPAAVHPHDRRQLLQPVPERLQGRPGCAQSLPAGVPQCAVRLAAQVLCVRRREPGVLLRRVLLAVPRLVRGLV